jgi:hypothetical protein
MPALSSRKWCGRWTLLIPLLFAGCGWQHTMTFRSPSRKAAIEIWQKGIDNSWGARVELVTTKGRTVLYRIPSESYIYFVHVYWSPDEAKVGVLGTGHTIFSVACNTATGALIPFEKIREDFGKSIRATYHVPPQEDPIQWAAMADAQVEFSKLHPEIRLSYQ